MDREFQLIKLRLVHDHRMREGEMNSVINSNSTQDTNVFRINHCYRSVSVFDETKADPFLQQFERVAKELGWW